MKGSKRKIGWIGGALGWGAQRTETEEGPRVLLEAGLLDHLVSDVLSYEWIKILTPAVVAKNHPSIPYSKKVTLIAEFAERLRACVSETLEREFFPVIIGGDHSLAIGSWSGVVSHLSAAQQFGLLWIDAHMDAHTQDTTPSHAIHGMPLAVLLGHGEKELLEIHPSGAILAPHHVVLYGVRSFEPKEAEFLARLHVRVYTMEEIRDRGVAITMEEALSIVSKAPKGFGVSVDLDAFDPSQAPGVGSPALGGLFSEVLLPELKSVLHHPFIKALEIAEFNPALDIEQKTLQLILSILDLF